MARTPAPKPPADEPGELPSEPLELQRYRLLIEQLGDEMGRIRGWQSRVAEKLGVSQSYVSKVLARKARSIGLGPIKTAQREMRLRAAFFTDPALTEPSYRRFQVGDPGKLGDWHTPFHEDLAESLELDKRFGRLEWEIIAELAERVARATETQEALDAVDSDELVRLAVLVLRTPLVDAAWNLLRSADESRGAGTWALDIGLYARLLLLGYDAQRLARSAEGS